MSFPAYSDTKDSEIPWVGPVPQHWQVLPLLAVATERYESNAGMQENNLLSLSYGRIVRKDIDSNDGLLPESFETYQVVHSGDIVLRLTDLQNDKRSLRSGQVIERGIITSAYLALKPTKVVSAFLSHLLRSYDTRKVFYSMGGGLRQSMKFADLKRMPVAVPPLAEQTAIASFLDRETAKIDALVEEQKRLIELLKEKRQAVISQAVTKGLDPSVPMKDSGVEWLGEVPVHWTICTLRRLIRKIEQGWSPECEAQPADEEGWGVLKAGCVNRGVFNPDENKTLPESLSPVSDYEVRLGDILMSRASGSPELVGSTALVRNTRPRLMLSDKIFRIHLEPGQNSEFFVWTMNAKYMREQIEQALSGGNGLANNLPQSVLLSFKCAVPPEKEQVAVGERLNQEVIKLDHLLGEAASSIDLLNERRAALISAAVTGKIDVRSNDSGANLPSRGRGHTK